MITPCTGALQGGFREASTATLTLPGCDIDTFELFLHYLVNRDLPDSELVVGHAVAESDGQLAAIVAYQAKLVRLWIFADAIMMPRLQNCAAHDIVRMCRFIHPDSIETIFTATREGSRLRLLAVRSFLYIREANTCFGTRYFSKQDSNRLMGVPGFMGECFEEVGRSVCRSFFCSCATHCSLIDPAQRGDYLVNES